MKLHLGCGNQKLEGYINCDYSKEVNPDMIVDLEKPLTMFEDNSVDEIYSRHTFEHIKNFMELMEEIHRICKNKAKIEVRVPYFAHVGAFQDPTHVRFFTIKTFEYFSKDSELNFYSKARFKIKERKLVSFVLRPKISKILDFFINSNQRIYERFFSRIFSAEELRIILEVEK